VATVRVEVSVRIRGGPIAGRARRRASMTARLLDDLLLLRRSATRASR
jgi:hypothetical protein